MTRLTRLWPRRARACPPNVEQLEDRFVLSADGLPDISGPANVSEGGLYTLNLDSAGKTLVSWQIDWDDGTVELLPGSATQATHTYADGLYHANIVATAVETSPLTFFQWSSATGATGH